MESEFPNVNAQWSYVIAETLNRKGVQYAVICPGSRSSPLVFELVSCMEIKAFSVLDERSASFFALGLARRTGKPVVLVCTSGTAAANFFPAVIEASESGAPLIVLTADRPHELRDCAAGQTIDQVKLYGHYPRFQYELPLPENSMTSLRSLRQAVVTAYDRALWPSAGPVHINAPFREPLPPTRDNAFKSVLEGISLNTFAIRIRHPIMEAKNDFSGFESFFSSDKGIIVVGPANLSKPEAWLSNLSQLANDLQWPILADALNPIRFASGLFENLICHYDFIARNTKRRKSFTPKRVLIVGELPTSKALRQWLQSLECETLVLTDRPRNVDPSFAKTTHLQHDFQKSAVEVSNRESSEFLDTWKRFEVKIAERTKKEMELIDSLFEGKVARELVAKVPEGCSVSVSNGMPPRDMEFFAEANERRIEVYSSRGASGIDGILSTALGITHLGKPTFLLTGDLALLHDSNGGLIAKSLKGALTIVLINNDGGGIFEMLPVSQFGNTFEEFFATPQNVAFQAWAKTYGIEHSQISNWDELSHALASDWTQGVRILEVRTDRKFDANFRKRLIEKISKGL